MPEISVIVPVYNVENKIRRCIDSILAQTFTDFELILVDDGSPDKSGEICEEYAINDKRIRVIHKENGGLSEARNSGLNIAVGQYVMFLDSDDYITCDCLEVLSGQNTDFVIGTIFWSYENGELINQKERTDEKIIVSDFGKKLPDLLGERRLNYVHAKLYCMHIIRNNHLSFEDDMLTSAEDTVFNFTFLKYCKSIYISSKPVHYYMQYSDGLASKFYSDRYKRFHRLSDFISETCKSMSIYNEKMKAEIARRRVLSAVWCIDALFCQKKINYNTKKDFLDGIYFDNELRDALTTICIDEYEDLLYLMKNGSKKLIIHKLSNKIKGVILTKTPRFIISLVKRN